MYTGDDGLSHFEDTELDFKPGAGRFPRAGARPARETGFTLQPAHDQDTMHNAPERRIVVFLSGGVNVELSDGASRTMGPGDVVLFEDMTGAGHRLIPLGNEPRASLYIALGRVERVPQKCTRVTLQRAAPWSVLCWL